MSDDKTPDYIDAPYTPTPEYGGRSDYVVTFRCLPMGWHPSRLEEFLDDKKKGGEARLLSYTTNVEQVPGRDAAITRGEAIFARVFYERNSSYGAVVEVTVRRVELVPVFEPTKDPLTDKEKQARIARSHAGGMATRRNKRSRGVR